MSRFFTFAVAASLVTSMLLPSASAQQRDDRIDNVIVQRLDKILSRLDAIETRLSKLEDEVRDTRLWTVDDHGIIRTLDGRNIGIWGIDGLPSKTVR